MLRSPRTLVFIFCFDALLFLLCIAGVYHVAEKADLPAVYSDKYDIIENIYNSLFTDIPSASMQDSIIVTKPDVISIHNPLREDDRIVSFNGIPVSKMEQIEFLCDGSRIRNIVELGIKREGRTTTAIVELVPFYASQYIVIEIIVGSLFFFLGIFVLYRRPNDDAAFVYHCASLAVAVIIMTTWGCYSIAPFGLGHLIRILFSAAYAFTPVFFVHFSFVFPKEKFIPSRKIITPMYIAAFILFLAMSITFLCAAIPRDLEWFKTFLLTFKANQLFFALSIIFGIWSLFHSHRTASEESERRKLRWVIFGIAFTSLGFILLWQIPALLGFNVLVMEETILVLSAVAPITFAISIVRYHILDIDRILNRSTVYVIVLSGLLTLYIGILSIINYFIGLTVFASIYVSATLAIVITLFFDPSRRSIQLFVDRKFFRVRYNFREAQRRFLDEIKRFIDVSSLAEYIVRETNELIPVERIGFFIHQQKGNRMRLVAHRNFVLLEGRGLTLDKQKMNISLRLPIVSVNNIEPGVPFDQADEKFLRRWNIAAIFPMLSESADILGFFVLGEKKSGVRFNIEDIDLLSSISAQTGLAIERITLEKQLIIKSEEARRLDELNRLKSFFVSSVSHELKTPLTSIRMFAELLKSQEKLSREKTNDYLSVIEGETDRLTRLINNVLNFARIERGVKEYHFSDCDVGGTIQSVMNMMRYQFSMQHCNIHLNFEHGKITISADSDAIAEALVNLLSNAIKYSLEDKRNISISTSLHNNNVLIAVRDQGYGIPQDDIANIFDPFYRVKNEHTKQAGGTGLGLSLVRNIMDAHGGKVLVESEVGTGSCFTLVFPITREDAPILK